MPEYQITCVTQKNGVITHVGVGGKTHSVSEIINYMMQGVMFYTYKNGYKARVHRKQNQYGTWFLTTNPDSILENNLDFLTPCI